MAVTAVEGVAEADVVAGATGAACSLEANVTVPPGPVSSSSGRILRINSMFSHRFLRRAVLGFAPRALDYLPFFTHAGSIGCVDDQVKSRILRATGADAVLESDCIQRLWNDYGKLLRVNLQGGDFSSVILKHIILPDQRSHPKGFATNLSHQRKVRSYQVETCWYERFNQLNQKDENSRTARMLDAFQTENEFFILLEDLDAAGFNKRLQSVSDTELHLVLDWLACFHARYMRVQPDGLWPVGTYWHLETRPDELRVLDDLPLKRAAPLLDARLRNTEFQTIVHGDAKLANFCFSADSDRVAAVDFQYVGGGCGMKDLTYFVGSCLDERESETEETAILDFYFDSLKKYLVRYQPAIDAAAVEADWRPLYRTAWTDFHRFLKGWSPGHWKINTYSEKICRTVVAGIYDEIAKTAESACLAAGELIRSYWRKDFAIAEKAGTSPTSTVVTEVDHRSQDAIIQTLQPIIDRYNLGLLAEEDNDDGSRLQRAFFLAIDPLDGTLHFSQGRRGFGVSIALIDRAGNAVAGVIYDPVDDRLFRAVDAHGVFCNGKPFQVKPDSGQSENERIHVFADRSLQNSERFAALSEECTFEFTGGAVMNAINALDHGHACYFKLAKRTPGGCAVWDIAAIAVILQEAGGSVTSIDGQALCYNKPDSLYYNQEGLLAACSAAVRVSVLKILAE